MSHMKRLPIYHADGHLAHEREVIDRDEVECQQQRADYHRYFPVLARRVFGEELVAEDGFDDVGLDFHSRHGDVYRGEMSVVAVEELAYQHDFALEFVSEGIGPGEYVLAVDGVETEVGVVDEQGVGRTADVLHKYVERLRARDADEFRGHSVVLSGVGLHIDGPERAHRAAEVAGFEIEYAEVDEGAVIEIALFRAGPVVLTEVAVYPLGKHEVMAVMDGIDQRPVVLFLLLVDYVESHGGRGAAVHDVEDLRDFDSGAVIHAHYHHILAAVHGGHLADDGVVDVGHLEVHPRHG